MNLQKRQYGVTLLETMLALAIAISLVVFGLRVYYQFSMQAQEQKIGANVNQLFQALKGFYDANCRQSLDSNSTAQSSGKLDPASSGSSIPQTFPLSIVTDLQTPGFLTGWQPLNYLVDNTQTEKGYYAQFNRITTAQSNDPVMSIYACSGSSKPPSCDVTNGNVLQSTSSPSLQSHVVTWVAQVAVKLSNSLTPQQWIQIKNDLNADCISTTTSSDKCTSNPTTTGYLIWKRAPSAYNENISSVYWTATPYVKQFNMQYTNDGMATLSGVKDETRDSTALKNWYNPLNYLCGG